MLYYLMSSSSISILFLVIIVGCDVFFVVFFNYVIWLALFMSSFMIVCYLFMSLNYPVHVNELCICNMVIVFKFVNN